jgi:hypothetical protein
MARPYQAGFDDGYDRAMAEARQIVNELADKDKNSSFCFACVVARLKTIKSGPDFVHDPYPRVAVADGLDSSPEHVGYFVRPVFEPHEPIKGLGLASYFCFVKLAGFFYFVLQLLLHAIGAAQETQHKGVIIAVHFLVGIVLVSHRMRSSR